MWKLHGLLESVVLDKRLQFAAELTRELNRMLGIEMKLSIAFHSQTDSQTERINQELEKYLQFFINYKQKDWPEQLAIAEFAVNNKAHSATKVSLFMTNYKRKLRMGADIRKKEKVKKVIKFVQRMKKVQKEVEVALRKAQEEIKQVDRRRKKVKEQKKRDKVMLSMKNLVFKEQYYNQYLENATWRWAQGITT